jgi:hypothetical protein
MFRVDKVKSSFNCHLCNKLLVDPVVMPCDNFICITHLDNVIDNTAKSKKDTFVCELCQEEHPIPKNGFVVSKRLQDLLQLELNTLKFDCPIFDQCKKEIEEAKQKMNQIELLENNSETFIYDYFEDIKRQVDIRREGLKQKIDDYSNEIITSINKNQVNYIKLSKEINQMSKNIEKSKKEFNDLRTNFDTLEFNENKFKEIKTSVEVLNKEFQAILDEYGNSLVGNKKYTFEFKESPIEDILGRFSESNLEV